MTRHGTKNRIFYMHSAHKGVGVSRFAQFAQWQEDNGRQVSPLAVDVFSSHSEQDSSRRLIAELMSFHPETNWLLQAHFDRGLPAAAPSEESDCILILAGAEPFSSAMLAGFRAYAESGGALVAVNAGMQTSPEWRNFAKEILGAELEIAAAVEKTSPRIAAGRHFHPVLRNVSAWDVKSACFPKLDSQAIVFLEGTDGQERHPLAWGLDNGKKRIFSTTLGTPEDFFQPSFFRLVWNALSWTMGMPSD
jgi:hypothetical protein